MELGQRDELRRLGAARCRFAAAPEGSHRRREADENHDDRSCRHPPDLATPGRVGCHGASERLLDGGQAARITLLPELELLVGGSRPEQIVRAALLLPELRLVPELVAELGALGVLRLPAHQAGPGGQQRLVDDLDAVGSGGVFRGFELEGRE